MKSHSFFIKSAAYCCMGLLVIIFLCHCKKDKNQDKEFESLFFIDYRDLSNGPDGVAIMELDPESKDFGTIISKKELDKGVLPHHIYFNRKEKRVYTTALGAPYLYELVIGRDDKGYPVISTATPVNTGGNEVGEDMFFTKDGRFFVTFMGGHGGQHGGSIGVFDANDNKLIKTVMAPREDNPNKFILHPHGISADEDKRLLMVTSTIHPDLSTTIGNTCTLLDMDTYEIQETYLVADNVDDKSSPVEILLTRGEFPNYALVTAMLGGDIWIAGYDAATKRYKQFTRFYKGKENGLGWPLEFYVGPDKLLYVSFAEPGKVLVFDISQLPAAKLVRVLQSDPGSHHMAFFKTKSGREVVAVQNNMLNLPNINAGTITVFDIKTGERLATANLKSKYNIQPESIESTTGHGHYMHH